MKKLLVNLAAICLATVLFSFVWDAKKHLVGTWNFTAVGAPEGYDQGQIEFVESEGKLQGKMVTANETFEMENLKMDHDSLTYELKVKSAVLQGLLVAVRDSLSGTIKTPMGDLPIKAGKQPVQ